MQKNILVPFFYFLLRCILQFCSLYNCFVFLCLPICLFVYVCFSPSFCLSVSLSVCLSIHRSDMLIYYLTFTVIFIFVIWQGIYQNLGSLPHNHVHRVFVRELHHHLPNPSLKGFMMIIEIRPLRGFMMTIEIRLLRDLWWLSKQHLLYHECFYCFHPFHYSFI